GDVREAALVGEAGHVADDALAVILPQRRALHVGQRLVGVGVRGVLPDLVGVLVTLLAPLRADVGRYGAGHGDLHGVVALAVLGQVAAALQLLGVVLHELGDRVGALLALGRQVFFAERHQVVAELVGLLGVGRLEDAEDADVLALVADALDQAGV